MKPTLKFIFEYFISEDEFSIKGSKSVNIGQVVKILIHLHTHENGE